MNREIERIVNEEISEIGVEIDDLRDLFGCASIILDDFARAPNKEEYFNNYYNLIKALCRTAVVFAANLDNRTAEVACKMMKIAKNLPSGNDDE